MLLRLRFKTFYDDSGDDGLVSALVSLNHRSQVRMRSWNKVDFSSIAVAAATRRWTAERRATADKQDQARLRRDSIPGRWTFNPLRSRPYKPRLHQSWTYNPLWERETYNPLSRSRCALAGASATRMRRGLASVGIPHKPCSIASVGIPHKHWRGCRSPLQPQGSVPKAARLTSSLTASGRSSSTHSSSSSTYFWLSAPSSDFPTCADSTLPDGSIAVPTGTSPAAKPEKRPWFRNRTASMMRTKKPRMVFCGFAETASNGNKAT